MAYCSNCLPILDIGINENLFIPKDVFSPPEFWRSGIFILFLAVERGTERLNKGKKKMMIMKRKKARYENLRVVKEAIFITKKQKIAPLSVINCKTHR